MAAPQMVETSPPSDGDLIGQVVANGDHAAFELLYQRYFRRVYRFVDKRLQNRADTEETVQEIFINVFSSLASYRGEASFAAWVLGVSRRTIASRFKKKRHATVPFGSEDEDEVDLTHPSTRRQPTPHDQLECNERIRRIEAAAQRLTPEQAQLVELHHLMDHSIQDLSRSLRKSEDSIKSNLYRARKLLLAR